ncbi:hypothetical protein GCM10027567_30820 [Spongiibacter taiwanensis]
MCDLIWLSASPDPICIAASPEGSALSAEKYVNFAWLVGNDLSRNPQVTCAIASEPRNWPD